MWFLPLGSGHSEKADKTNLRDVKSPTKHFCKRVPMHSSRICLFIVHSRTPALTYSPARLTFSKLSRDIHFHFAMLVLQRSPEMVYPSLGFLCGSHSYFPTQEKVIPGIAAYRVRAVPQLGCQVVQLYLACERSSICTAGFLTLVAAGCL